MICIPLMLPAALGSEKANIYVELNKLENVNDHCQSYFVTENHTSYHYSSLVLDLVIFDIDGIVDRRLRIQLAPLPPGKTSLQAYVFTNLSCAGIGRILINNVLECVAESMETDNCISIISASSRTNAALII